MRAKSSQSRTRLDHGFTLVELLIVIAIIGVLVALLLPAVQAAREAARRSHCLNNLKQIGVALHLYHDAHKSLPPGGVTQGPCCETKSYANWAIELLPFIEEQALIAQYDQHAFNEDEINQAVRESIVATYYCPSEPYAPNLDERASGPGADLQWMPGSYRAMTGRATYYNWWGNYSQGNRSLEMSSRGALHTVGNPGPTGRPNLKLSPVRFRQIVDGLSTTIVIGERSIEMQSGGTNHLRRTAWAYAYGHYSKSAAHLDARMFLRDYRTCIRTTGPSWEHACKQGWSSFHPGGMHFVHCDGSAYFQTDTIDLELFAAKATIAGQE